MKKVIFFLLLFCMVTPGFAFIESFGPEYDGVIELFQGQNEPDAMDAIWETETLLKVGVFKHEKDYDDYASHVCEVIGKNGFAEKEIAVQVIDIKKLAEASEWVVLGKAECQ